MAKKDDLREEQRRKVLKSTLAGGAVITTSILPKKWTKPALDSVVLPAHAATTATGGEGGTTAPPTTAPPTTPPPKTTAPTNVTSVMNFSIGNNDFDIS